MIIGSPKLGRLCRDLGKVIIPALAQKHQGAFPTEAYMQAVYDDLGKYDLNHSEYRWDIARTFVRADLAERAKVNPFKKNDKGQIDLSQLDPREMARGVIRGGNGMNTPMALATSRTWLVRINHQQDAANAAQEAASLTTQWLQTEAGILLMENPRLHTYEAMRELQLPLWAEMPVESNDPDDETED